MILVNKKIINYLGLLLVSLCYYSCKSEKISLRNCKDTVLNEILTTINKEYSRSVNQIIYIDHYNYQNLNFKLSENELEEFNLVIETENNINQFKYHLFLYEIVEDQNSIFIKYEFGNDNSAIIYILQVDCQKNKIIENKFLSELII
jgi:hypothetical protein